MKEKRPTPEQMEELVFELIMLCKRWGLWDGLSIGCGDKKYMPSIIGNASAFRELNNVIIQRNDRPCRQTGIVIRSEGGVFPELVCFRYDPDERTLSDKLIEYLVQHDDKFRLCDKHRRDYIEYINRRIKEYRDKMIFDHTDIDDTEFEDYREFNEYRHGELVGYEYEISSLEDELEEFNEHIREELYGTHICGKYCEIPDVIIGELKAIAQKYDMFIMTEDCREFYFDPWCDFIELTETFLPNLIYIPERTID